MLMNLKSLAETYRIRPKGVLHVGAHFGQEAPYYREIGVERMIFVEALSHVFAQLEINIQPYPQATAIKACISNVDGEEVTFNISNNEGQSSSLLKFGTHKIAHPEVDFIGTETMITTRLDTLFADVPVECDLLNLDLQGAELLALEGMGAMLRDFKWLYIEVNKDHLYEGCPLIGELDVYLANFGFTRKETRWCGNFGWGDALYVR